MNEADVVKQFTTPLGASAFAPPPREKIKSPLSCYDRCGDHRWLMLVVNNEERDGPRLTAAMEHLELTADPRYATRAARYENSEALVTSMDGIFARRERDDWRGRPDAADIPNDRQKRESGAVVTLEGEQTPTIETPFYVEGAGKTALRRPPELGAHGDAVLREAGYDPAAVDALHQNGVVA